MTPFQLLYGYLPPLQECYVPVNTYVAVVEDMLQQRNIMIQLAKDNLEVAHERMKNYADKKRTYRSFDVGDWVYLILQPYRQSSVAMRRNLKLSARYYGPFQILAKVGLVAYKLQLLAQSKIHHVFHVSQLKKKLGAHITHVQNLPYADEEGQMRVQPMAILSRRMIKRRNSPVGQVKWLNSAHEDATWEDWSFIASNFPDFNP